MTLRPFVFGLIATFALPWLLLIVIPHQRLEAIQPTAYTEEDREEQMHSFEEFPEVKTGRALRGRQVYANEGCAYCHTQVIRPTFAGGERNREGWAGRPANDEEGTPSRARESRPEDYMGEPYALFGNQRNGPDLSNIGWRIPDRAWHHEHLYNPRGVDAYGETNNKLDWSTMPSYKHLYEERAIRFQKADNALELSGKDKPAEGYEIVPTPEAEALVDYLLSLKRDMPIPESVEHFDLTKRSK